MVQPFVRIPRHRKRAHALEPNARIVRLDEGDEAATGEEKPPRRALDAVENRLRQLRLEAREGVVDDRPRQPTQLASAG